MNNLLTRTLSGSLFVLIIVGAILMNEYVFASVFALISGISILEFHKITNTKIDINVNKWLALIGGILLFLSSFVFASGKAPSTVFLFYGLYLMLVLIYELYAQKQNPINNWAYFMLGQVFIALPFSLLNFILYINDYQPFILLSVFITIWVNDTGAYITGISFGKHRLFERISPKKSWEGFFGGAFFAIISGYIFSLTIPLEISLLNWIVLSEIIVVFGTYGDLLESLLKRTIGVKDSGNIMPGHGGLLDRFDSMLLAAPAVIIYLSLIFS